MNGSETTTPKAVSPETRVQIRVAAQPHGLALVRDVTRGAIATHPELRRDEERSNEISVAVQEACNNVVRHAYVDRPTGVLDVELDVHSERVDITVSDDGPGFDPSRVAVPTGEEPSEGGYGIYLMRGLMDEVAFDHDGGRHRVRMRKWLEGKVDDGLGGTP